MVLTEDHNNKQHRASDYANSVHHSVLLTEAIASLAIKPAGYYIDATFGRGGHSRAILSLLNADGQLMVIDKDATAVDYAKHCFANDARVLIRHGSFTQLQSWVMTVWPGVDGVLFDLGVSSPQLDEATRGFSFQQDGPLDMRMNTHNGQTAADWLAIASANDIADVLKCYGEERYAKRIANAIVDARIKTPITRTHQLADIIAAASPTRERHKHPATRSFQAIRIYINNELNDLEQGLSQAVSVLKQSGRLAVISFHSLEDRITKQFIKQQSTPAPMPRGLPIRDLDNTAITLRRCGKAIKSSCTEVAHNPRARSAVLRVAEKI